MVYWSMKDGNSGNLTFVSSNESICAAREGLDIKNGSRGILTILGSGDHAFAFSEYGFPVTAVDTDPLQVAYALVRIDSLKAGQDDFFLKPQIVRDFWHVCEYGVGMQARNKYFSKPGRIERIRSHLDLLEIKQANVFECAQENSPYDKIYLSSAFTWHGPRMYSPSRRGDLLSKLAEPLPDGGLIYVSDGDWTLKGVELHSNLIIDEELTEKAHQHEKYRCWDPTVFRRI